MTKVDGGSVNGIVNFLAKFIGKMKSDRSVNFLRNYSTVFNGEV